MTQIFISHSHKDDDVLRRIVTILDNEGIKKWVDTEQLQKLGSKINQKINEGLSNSNYFLLLWSKHAANSSFVAKEYNASISDEYDTSLLKIILRLDDTKLPPLLSDILYFKINDAEITVENIIEMIAKKIKDEEKINLDNNEYDYFDEYLDGLNPVVIMGYNYSLSVSLKTLDPTRYNEIFLEWKENNQSS